jgi:DNA polymerase III alpha subunit
MNNDLVVFDNEGTPFVSGQGIIELAYQNKLDNIFEWQDSPAKSAFLQQCEKLDYWPIPSHASDPQKRDWFTPEEYKCLDLKEYCLTRCVNKEQTQRALLELGLISSLNAEPIFHHLIYLVDTWRSHGLVWGVGRGSSVSCFVLYLIGVNKINPLDYDLDYQEFFKIKY